MIMRKALFRSLSIFVFSVIDRDECQNGATHSAIGLMKVVHILSRSCLDTLKVFNLDSMYTQLSTELGYDIFGVQVLSISSHH